MNPVVDTDFTQPASPLAPNGTPIADVGNVGGSVGAAANAATAAVNQAVAEAAEMAQAENEAMTGRLMLFAIAGVIGFFVLREMKVI